MQRTLAIAIAAVWLAAGSVRAHPESYIWAQMLVEPGIVRLRLRVPVADIIAFQKLKADGGAYSRDSLARAAEAHRAFVLDHLSIFGPDGDPLLGEVIAVQFPPMGPDGLSDAAGTKVFVDYSLLFVLSDPPDHLTFQQSMVDEGENALAVVELVVQQEGFPERDSVLLNLGELERIEFDWNAVPPAVEAKVPKEPEPPWPLVPVFAALFAAAVLLAASKPLKLPRLAVALGVGLVGVSGAFGWRQAVDAASVPRLAEIHERFAALQTGVYDAFEAESEDEIYERLTPHVAPGPLLDRIYSEVYGAWRGATTGGPKVQIEEVKIRHLKVLDRSPQAFRVECEWSVRGNVTHWGHTHMRLNLYRARYRAVAGGGAWKLKDVELLKQVRAGRRRPRGGEPRDRFGLQKPEDFVRPEPQ